jgi:hypothetical protein
MGAGMTIPLSPVVIALTRGWLAVYTSHAPRPLAESRRAEIESDLWEMAHDAELAPGLQRGWIALTRLLAGIPDDLAWRLDNAAVGEQLFVRRVCAFTAATLLVLSLWTVPSWFFSGRQEVATCAATAPHPQTNADFRLEVMRCAGAFFSPGR